MVAQIEPIAATLRDPTTVTKDTDRVDRVCFYRLNALPAPLAHLYLKVVVELAGDTGTIITAYPLPEIKKGEAPLWP